ncbi:MAG: amidohydrolase family protein [Candidatus Odinarchaeota archaeon]
MVEYPDFPPSKVTLPIIDAHVHLDDVKYILRMYNQAKLFNIQQFIGISTWYKATTDYSINENLYPETYHYAFYVPSNITSQPGRYQKELFRYLENFKPREKLKVVKFWYGSSFFHDGFRIDSPAHQEVYQQISASNLVLMIHIADPDRWYRSNSVKKQQLQQFVNIVANNPELNVIGVHMAGNSERLSELAEWLDTYPNLFLDTSATKWITRELSRKPEDAREFFIRYSNRLLYGSDLVNSSQDDFYYHSRYWTHRILFETSLTRELPFNDPDSSVQPASINGLDLPVNVLEKFYHTNAKKILGF